MSKPKQPSSFPGETKKKLGSSGHGFSSPGYKKKKKTGRGHTWQSQKRMDRLRNRQFMKEFSGKSRKTILV